MCVRIAAALFLLWRLCGREVQQTLDASFFDEDEDMGCEEEGTGAGGKTTSGTQAAAAAAAGGGGDSGGGGGGHFGVDVTQQREGESTGADHVRKPRAHVW